MNKYIGILIAVLIIGLNLIAFKALTPQKVEDTIIVDTKPDGNTLQTDSSLPRVESLAQLKKILSEAKDKRGSVYGFATGAVEEAVTMDLANTASAQKSTSAAEYSTTNVQVQGVDEADTIKTDGKYLYQIQEQQVVISEVYPSDNLKMVKKLKFQGEYWPQELYIDDKYLVVIGHSSVEVPLSEDEQKRLKSDVGVNIEIYPPVQTRGMLKAIIFDISDKTKIKELRQVELEGHYLTSRKIGSTVYFVANKYVDYYILEQGGDPSTPFYKDSVEGKEHKEIDYKDICYFPETVEPNYLMIAAVNLAEPEAKMEVATYLGAGQNVYASKENLYVAVPHYGENEVTSKETNAKDAPVQSDLADDTTMIVDILPIEPAKVDTIVYKFALDKGKINYLTKGQVPGTILNQFSMDEYQGNFRIATTKGDAWSEHNPSENNLYVLDQELNRIGKIENIAPGERIYSVRFMGEKAYMVTFKTVDPLFVIDLKDPKAPKILGSLKIPGYSDYLHPYDENHIIGFGKETIEVKRKDGSGKEQTMAFYLGMKIAIFDVSDVSNPKEMFKEIIGGRGTESELLHNHKALLFSKDKNLMAFPITVMNPPENRYDSEGFPQYGEFAFEGAYVYNIDLEKGFQLRGKISHLSNSDYDKSGYSYRGSKNIQRILYIGDDLYTVSPDMIKVHEMDSLKEKGQLETR